MKIHQVGGEFALINRLTTITAAHHNRVICGIGDDAAVLETAPPPAPYLLVTNDVMVENHHFKRRWTSPQQIGHKAGESNVSDIAAMGGIPDWMVVSLTLPGDIDVEWIECVYQGLADCCGRHSIAVVGGDTTQGPAVVIGITLLGHVAPDQLCLRSQAQDGDLLMVTGFLGASAAGLALLEKGKQPSAYLQQRHLAPHCRIDIAGTIAPLANAMIDISDGLAAEVLHICEQSKVGAELLAEDIVLHPDVKAAGDMLDCDPLDWVLNGGEDYELLFTMTPQKVAVLKGQGITCQQIGRITAGGTGAVLHTTSGSRIALAGGFNHFGA